MIASASPLVSSRQHIAGAGAGEWLARWLRWRWALSGRHPSPVRSCITADQPPGVWFLGFADVKSGPRTGVRRCTIPRGRYLINQVLDVDCSTVEPAPFHAVTPRGLTACARRDWRRAVFHLSQTLDGRPLPPGRTVVTPVFRFHIPLRDNDLFVHGRTRGRAAAAGLIEILRPLRPGRHVLVFRIEFAGGPLLTTIVRIRVS